MNAILTNWQTSLPGIALLVQAIYEMIVTKTIDVDLIMRGLAGLGLVAAKDWNVTGGSKSA